MLGVNPVPAGVGSHDLRTPDERERDAWAILAGVEGLGPIGFGALLGRFGSARAVLETTSEPGGIERLAGTRPARPGGTDGPVSHRLGPGIARAIGEAAQGADATLARLRSLGIQVVTIADRGYPRRLGSIEMPPHLLFVQGSVGALDGRSLIAVVGTRRPTDHGRTTAGRIVASLVAVGTTVVSGLAVGIDGAAHAATLREGGRTVAVIGSGHAVLQPVAHRRLATSIVDRGGAVVSEHAPDVHATRGTFPRRNRVVSGLADATVVVEAPARSGALITASWALEQGRECFLVPGPIDAPASAGCLAFLREFAGGARIVAGIPQLLEDLGLAGRLPAVDRDSPPVSGLMEVGTVAARVGEELLRGRATVDELVAVTGLSVATVLAALTLLERRGLAVGVHGRFRASGDLDRPVRADPRVRQARRG